MTASYFVLSTVYKVVTLLWCTGLVYIISPGTDFSLFQPAFQDFFSQPFKIFSVSISRFFSQHFKTMLQQSLITTIFACQSVPHIFVSFKTITIKIFTWLSSLPFHVKHPHLTVLCLWEFTPENLHNCRFCSINIPNYFVKDRSCGIAKYTTNFVY